MFIMNFKEIHSNTEFLSTYCRGRGLLLPKLNQITLFIEKWLERNVQATFGAFRFLRVGGTHVQLHSQENEIYLTFSKS